MTSTVPWYTFILALSVSACAYVLLLLGFGRRRPFSKRGPDEPSTWGWAKALAVFGVFILAEVAAATVAVLIFKFIVGKVGSPVFFSAMIFLTYLFNLPALLLVLRIAGRGGGVRQAFGTMGLRVSSPVRSVAFGIWAFLLYFPCQIAWAVLVDVAFRVMGKDGAQEQQILASLMEAGPVTLFILAVSVVLAAPFFEELIFRGIMQRGLERSLGARAGIVVTVLLFSVVHGLSGAVLVLPVAVALGVLYYKTRDLMTCMVFHFAVNFTSILGVLELRSALP